MTDQESFLIMGFLRKLINTRPRSRDPLADKLINESISVQPNTNYLLVQRAIFLELELEKTQAQLKEIQEKFNIDPKIQSSTQFLGDSFDDWGKNLEEPRSSIFDKDPNSKKAPTLEDRIIKFLMKNSIKLWILVLVISVLIFFLRRA
jgi:hypothetical protein